MAGELTGAEFEIRRPADPPFDRPPAGLHPVLAIVASRPQGIARQELIRAAPALDEKTINDCLASGWVEASPIHDGWVRWAQPSGPFAEAAAWVRLRRHAADALAQVHAASGLPVTLHVLVAEGHAVIERFPVDDVRAIVAETARYAHPRPLTSGITSKVFLAALPRTSSGFAVTADLGSVKGDELADIRNRGYGYALAAPPATDAVLSVAVSTGDHAPICAICTFGPAVVLTEQRGRIIGPSMASLGIRLAHSCREDPILEAAARSITTGDTGKRDGPVRVQARQRGAANDESTTSEPDTNGRPLW